MEIRKIAALKTAAQFLDHLARLDIHLPFDPQHRDRPPHPPGPAAQVDGFEHPQPLVRPAHGRLGRHARRPAQRADPPALAALWLERGRPGLGRRSRRGAPRWPRQPQPAGHPPGHTRRPVRPARRPGRGLPPGHRRQRQPGDRPAADPFGPFFAPQRQSARTAPGLRPPAAQSAFRPARSPPARSSPTSRSRTWSRILSARPRWPRKRGSTSSTSNTATATCCTNFSRRSSGRENTAAAWKTAPARRRKSSRPSSSACPG